MLLIAINNWRWIDFIVRFKLYHPLYYDSSSNWSEINHQSWRITNSLNFQRLKPFIPTTQLPSCKSFLRYSSSWTASCKSAIDFTSSLSSQWKESSILPLIHLDVSTFCKNSKSFRWVFLLIEDVATMTQFDLDANAVLRATTSGTGLTSQNDLSTVEKCLVLRRAAAETWLISNDSSQAIGSLYSWIVFLMLAPPQSVSDPVPFWLHLFWHSFFA